MTGGGADARAKWLNTLTKAERTLFEAFPHGAEVDFPPGTEIRAEVVAALALGAVPAVPGRTAGVRIRGARVVGELDLRHGTVEAPLTMLECTFTDEIRMEEAVTRSVDLSDSQLVGLRATGAHIRGSLGLRGARLAGGGSGGSERTLSLHKLTLDTDLNATALHCSGRVNLIGSNIGAVLDLNDSRLEHPGDVALNLGGAHVARSVYLNHADIRGHLRMPGLTVGGVLALSGTRLTEPPADGEFAHQSLTGDGLTVGGDAEFDSGFSTAGQVDLGGGNFGGRLRFKGARLAAGKEGWAALNLNGAEVRRGLYLGDGFHADGIVRLTGVRVGGHLDVYRMAPGSGQIQLYYAYAATVRDGRTREGVLLDGGVDSWPDNVQLDGFTYTTLDPELPAAERIRLLRRQPTYAAQPYEFLAAHYRELGHDEDARRVLIEKERVRHVGTKGMARLTAVISRTVFGYGYQPRRAALLALTIQLLAAAFFALERPTPVHTEDRIAYDPVLYAADLFVPIVHFGQTDAFQSHGFAAWVAFALPYLGWALGLAIVAGASRTLSKGGGGIV